MAFCLDLTQSIRADGNMVYTARIQHGYPVFKSAFVPNRSISLYLSVQQGTLADVKYSILTSIFITCVMRWAKPTASDTYERIDRYSVADHPRMVLVTLVYTLFGSHFYDSY